MSVRDAENRRQRARLVVAALAVGLLYAIWPYMVGLLAVPILYVLSAPAYRWLAPRVGGTTAAWLLVVATLLLILLPAIWLLTVMIQETPSIVRGIGESTLLSRLAALRIAEIDVGAYLTNAAETLIEQISGRAFAVFGSATRGVLNLVIALTGLFFVLRSPSSLWAQVRDYLPFSSEAVEHLRVRFYSVTEATLVGTLLTAALQGLIVGGGFALVGLPNALFWGAITGFASILPVVGSALVWLPGVLVLVAGGRWSSALLLAGMGGILASNIDNVIRPIINRRVSQIHPMTTLLGAFAGLELFGLIGVLLGPLAISYFFELVRMYRQEYEWT